MSSMGKNNKDTSSYMNNRIPRKKTASSLTNSSSKSTVGVNFDSTSTNEKQPAVAAGIFALPIPRKGKDDKQSNNKKRTHDMSSIATTKKKVKTTAIPQDNNNNSSSLPINDNNIQIYQIVKEGRVSGYPIIVSQVGSEHDAILLGCKANPQEYLNNNKDGKVKIRWKFAGYNGLVPTNTVRLKAADFTPPIRKAAVLSGLLETGEEVVASKDDDGIDLGEDEDDDAPILKAVRAELLDSKVRSDKDGDYNDQEDKDEKLVCYERSASVGYAGGKPGTAAAASVDSNGTTSASTNQVGVGSEEVNASPNQNCDNNAESSLTFEPQVDEADTNSYKATPSIVTSQSGIKSENDDTDSVATDPMINEEVVPMEVKSDINVKTEGEDTDDDELKPSAVASNMNVKLEGEETDDEVVLQPDTSSDDVKDEIEAAYECDTDDDDPKPLEVTSDMNVKDEEEDTDDEMNTSSHSHDNPTISASTSESEEVNTAVVLEFFEQLNSCLQVYSLDGIKEMIKSHPSLLNATCPSDISKIKKGCTAMEALCCWEEGKHCTRYLLYDLVMLGGKATDKCYACIWERNCRDNLLEHLSVLFRSGHYPTNHFFLDYLSVLYRSGFKVTGSSFFFLDELAKELEGDGEEPTDFLGMLYKIVKLGDTLGIDGTIRSQLLIDNINSLPSLETGVTHSKGGPMEKLLNRLPSEKVRDLITEQEKQYLAREEERKKGEEVRKRILDLRQEEQKKKEQGTELMCSVCNILKNLHDDYFKNQRTQGDSAMCKECFREQKKKMEEEGMRTCSVCEIAKDRTDFSSNQWKKDNVVKCKDCIALTSKPAPDPGANKLKRLRRLRNRGVMSQQKWKIIARSIYDGRIENREAKGSQE